MNKELKTNWTVIDETIIKGKVKCRCICGVERMVNKQNVQRCLTKSCGCYQEPRKLKDLTNYKGVKIGDKFNKLTIIDEPFRKKINNGEGNGKLTNVIHFRCKCDCGNIVERVAKEVYTKHILGCGCTKLGQRQIGKMPRYFYRYLKIQAEQRNILFTVTFEELSELFDKQNNKCALSGVDLRFRSNSKIADGNASLDRIDSTNGYISGNVQWVHININYAKLSLTQQEFIDMCKRVVEYNQ